MQNKNWHRLNRIVLLADKARHAIDCNERKQLREIVREIGSKATEALKDIVYKGE